MCSCNAHDNKLRASPLVTTFSPGYHHQDIYKCSAAPFTKLSTHYAEPWLVHMATRLPACCSTQATAVVQMIHMLLHHGGVMQHGPAGQLQAASASWSASAHDYEHGGVNNDFLIKTAHPLAITYNDQSPRENHHLAAATKENLKPEHLFTPVCHSCT